MNEIVGVGEGVGELVGESCNIAGVELGEDPGERVEVGVRVGVGVFENVVTEEAEKENDEDDTGEGAEESVRRTEGETTTGVTEDKGGLWVGMSWEGETVVEKIGEGEEGSEWESVNCGERVDPLPPKFSTSQPEILCGLMSSPIASHVIVKRAL